MINYDELLAPAAKSMRPSGIRKFFDLAADMPHCISLGVGEPDFKTPWSVRDAGIRSLELGRTKYTANAGLKELRSEICNYLARRFENTGVNMEDLISIGTIGLIKAINTFRADKNIKLATYASRCIENEILMFLRKNSAQRTEISFDEPLSTDWDGKELLLSDVLGTDGDTVMRPIEADVDRKLLQDAVGKLSSREQDIITLRFGLGGKKEMTQKEVADHMGISQSYISRLEKRIILRLRREILKMS